MLQKNDGSDRHAQYDSIENGDNDLFAQLVFMEMSNKMKHHDQAEFT